MTPAQNCLWSILDGKNDDITMSPGGWGGPLGISRLPTSYHSFTVCFHSSPTSLQKVFLHNRPFRQSVQSSQRALRNLSKGSKEGGILQTRLLILLSCHSVSVIILEMNSHGSADCVTLPRRLALEKEVLPILQCPTFCPATASSGWKNTENTKSFSTGQKSKFYFAQHIDVLVAFQ